MTSPSKFTVATTDGEQEAHILGNLPVATPGGEAFPLLITYHPGDGDGAAVTEPWTRHRVCKITAGDLKAAGQVPVNAGRIAFERLVEVHGWGKVASALRTAKSRNDYES